VLLAGRTKRRPSVLAKKNSLSFLIGPPTAAAHWLLLHQVGGARVVQVQVRIHVVLAVDREHVRGGGKSVDAEVAVTAAGVHGRAGRGLSDVGAPTAIFTSAIDAVPTLTLAVLVVLLKPEAVTETV